jgi:haloalkane dehalogenase
MTKSVLGIEYSAAAVEHHELGDASLAVRRFGNVGETLVFVHGFPTHGYTWRFLIGDLAADHRCITVDLAGLGDSRYTKRTDFRFTAQARRLNALLVKLGIDRCVLVAHDTGATVVRVAALADPARVRGQVLINTEMPGHRPPYIPLFQKTASLPGAALSFRPLLAWPAYVKSSVGFGAFYSDKRLFDDPTRLGPYLDPLLASRERLQGMLGYLSGIEWQVVDALREGHARLAGPTLLVWGEDDATFPVAIAEKMVEQFRGRARLVRIRNASLMPHEEKPGEVVAAIREYLATLG